MSRRALKILHLASFSGNIGDNINHMGFRPWFERMLGRPVEWCDLEMREFYWGQRAWDESFVALANAHDLLVVGGGNYFELWVENSPNGMSFGLPPEQMRALRVPVFFNALGLDAGQGLGAESLARFRTFLDPVLEDPHVLVSLRNDGSCSTAERLLGARYAKRLGLLPDGGFFASVPDRPASDAANGTVIAVNLACDMADIRFAGFTQTGGQAGFAAEMASALGDIMAQGEERRLVFVPHVYHDLDIIAQVIRSLPDRLRRTRVAVAGYAAGREAARQVLTLYQSATLVLGMRFHANVGAIAVGTEVIGLTNYPQIGFLYDEIGLPDQAVDVSQPAFGAELKAKVTRTLSGALISPSHATKVIERVSAQRAAFEPELRAWARRAGLT